MPNPDEPGTYGISCDTIGSLKSVINIQFESTSSTPFNLTIPSEELSVGPFTNNASLCQTLINADDTQPAILGGSLLKHYYSIWDIGNKSLGFAELGQCSMSKPDCFLDSIITAVDNSSNTSVPITTGSTNSSIQHSSALLTEPEYVWTRLKHLSWKC